LLTATWAEKIFRIFNLENFEHDDDEKNRVFIKILLAVVAALIGVEMQNSIRMKKVKINN
jgi:hypothetical protein